MTLIHPEAIEPFCESTEEFHKAGAYALVLDRPDDFTEAWDRHYDARPDWFDAARTAQTLCYVGGTGDLLSRLEDHRDGEVRMTTLTEICDIDSLHTIWFAGGERYQQTEIRLARWLQQDRPRWHIHQR